ncbi:MAG: TonB-dependent receptor [Bacteroidales bacterium]|nr:TonB-dependent receptor [Bacteroidales bacterium]
MIRFIQKMTAMLVTLFAGVAAFAQVTTSSLGGRVADEAGEPLAGAAIVAVHTPTGTQYATIANSEGRYTIGGMRTGGPYTVEISFVGMTTIQVKDVVLKLGEPYELNVKLKSSSELNAVVVVSESSFNASITGAGQSFSRRAVETMPSIDRSIYDVVKFTPQASINKGGGISFAGSNNRYNSFQVDGAVANDTFGLASSGTNGGQTGANPISMDAIEEVQVVVAPFDVRQSGFTGGAINAVTKSGTNRVKGTFYTYLLNQDMIGTTPGKMDWGQERQKYDTQLNQTYGFTVGGPIIKNKMFLFLSAEYVKKEHPNVFTPANGTYENREDVKLGTPVVIGEKVYEYFNADLAQRVIDHYEATYGVGNTGESFTQHMDTDRAFNILGRLDWNVNSTNKLMIRYQYMDAYADKYGSGRYTYYFNNSSYKMADKTNTIVAELNSKCFPDMQNMFRVTGVFVRDHREVPYHGANMYIKDNMTIDLGTEYSSGANSMNSNTVTLTDNMTWTLGTHELTVGTHNEFYKFDNLFLQYAYGGYTYNSLADFFAGRLYEFNYRYSDPAVTGSDDPTNWRAVTYAAQLGAYVQDEWRPNTNLTLTYGLRVDVPMLTNSPTENPGFNNSYFTDGTIDPATGKFVPYKGVETPSISYEILAVLKLD